MTVERKRENKGESAGLSTSSLPASNGQSLNKLGIDTVDFIDPSKLAMKQPETVSESEIGKGEESASMEVPEDLACPITHELMKNPVVTADGHTYEKEAIESWFRSGKKTSPYTNVKLDNTSLIPNHLVKKLIVAFLEKNRRIKTVASFPTPSMDAKETLSSTSVLEFKGAETKISVPVSPAISKLLKEEEAGDVMAQVKLGVCYEHGTGVLKNEEKAVIMYRKAADRGSAVGQNNLGTCYCNGVGVNKDPQKAVFWYQKAADQGFAIGQRNLGICHYSGLGVDKKDVFQAMKYWQKAAEQGDVVAQFNIGVCYEHGTGVDKDPKQALAWYQRAADQGYAPGERGLGNLYDSGAGGDKNSSKAVDWWQKAADHGDATAQSNLGGCYQKGTGVDKDAKQALAWYQRAAKQGSEVGEFLLAYCYYNGIGVDKDQHEAVRWWQKAADHPITGASTSVIGAQYLLGMCYAQGTGVDKDVAQAAIWFRKAADQGFARAQTVLALCYARGYGVPQDLSQAVALAKQAAAAEDAEGMNALGVFYELGIGITRDFSQAVACYKKAAAKGSADAQSNLGWCYFNAVGVSKDNRLAEEWLQKAAAQGDAYAQGFCYQHGLGVTQNFSEASVWYQKAADAGHARAQNDLALCYENGVGVTKDMTQAIDWYKKAAVQGYGIAQKKLETLGVSTHAYSVLTDSARGAAVLNKVTNLTADDKNKGGSSMPAASPPISGAAKTSELHSQSAFFKPAKDLLKEEGVLDLLQEINQRAESGAKPIIEAINRYLEKEKNTGAGNSPSDKGYIILRELQGLLASSSLKKGQASIYETVFNAIKTKVDPKLVRRIEMHAGFAIPCEKAVILKEIYPQLFSFKSDQSISAP